MKRNFSNLNGYQTDAIKIIKCSTLDQHLEEKKEKRIEKEKEKVSHGRQAAENVKESGCNRRPEGPPLPSEEHPHSSLSLSFLSTRRTQYASANGSKKSNTKPRLDSSPRRRRTQPSATPPLRPVPRRAGPSHPAPDGSSLHPPPLDGSSGAEIHPSGRRSVSSSVVGE
jgi:hypothetical protein